MHIPEQAKPYLQGLKMILAMSLIIWILSKQKNFSCDDYAKAFRDIFECHLILAKKSDSGGIVTLTGTDLYSHQIVDCDDGSKWIAHHLDQLHIGDTIIKNKGQYTINVKRKHQSFQILFECDKVYRDTIK